MSPWLLNTNSESQLTEITQLFSGQTLRPNELKGERIPEAGRELEAIVQATEAATGTIMDAAEEIMGADTATPGGSQAVNDACMRIFEACSFQDITGQRISKVVSTFTFIEERLGLLEHTWGPEIADAAAAPEPEDEDSALMNGPALQGEGNDQDAVDNLFGEAVCVEDSNATSEAPVPEPPVKKAEPPVKKPEPPVKKAEPPMKNPEPEPKATPAVPATTASQAEIDALFD